MRHDSSPREMIEGLYEMAGQGMSYCHGMMQTVVDRTFSLDGLPEGARNALRRAKTVGTFTAKGGWTHAKPLGEIIEREGWGVAYLVTEMPMVKTYLDGLAGDGACRECLAKPVKPFLVTLDDYHVMMRTVLTEYWRMYVLYETYRRHQVDCIEGSGFFGDDPLAYEIEAVYRAYGAQLQTGRECLAKAIGAYSSGTDATTALTRNQRLGEIVDVQHRRDWCSTCAANVVRFEPDLSAVIE